MNYIKLYLIAFLVFFIIDFIWLGLVARNFYRDQIGFIMKDNFNMTAAILFYLVYIIGLIFFVIIRADSWQYALLAGMFFGFITYATYDITNLATLKDWPLLLTAVDIIWGSFLGGTTCLITYWLNKILLI